MSVRVMSDVFSADLGSLTDKLVLLALADHAADDGSSVYPSLARLSWKCDLTERAVRKVLRRLEQRRLIHTVEKATHHSTTRYQLDVAAIRAVRRSPLEDSEGNVVPPLTRSGGNVVPNRGERRSPNPSVEPSGETNHHVRASAKGDPVGFDLFWQQYPRKESKERARKAWAQLQPDDANRERILSALEVQKRSDAWKREGGRYVPHASSWLNGRRWEDEGTVVVKVRATGEIYVEPELVKVWNQHCADLLKAWAGDEHDAKLAVAMEPDLDRWAMAIKAMAKQSTRYVLAGQGFRWLAKVEGGRLINLEAVLADEAAR